MLGDFIDLFQGIFQIRLTYNCAHLRSTKETLTIEYFRIILEKKIRVKIFWGENFWGENFLGENLFWVKFLGENFLGENFGRNFFGRKFFGRHFFLGEIIWAQSVG